jgi:hypothetical protein
MVQYYLCVQEDTPTAAVCVWNEDKIAVFARVVWFPIFSPRLLLIPPPSLISRPSLLNYVERCFRTCASGFQGRMLKIVKETQSQLNHF